MNLFRFSYSNPFGYEEMFNKLIFSYQDFNGYQEIPAILAWQVVINRDPPIPLIDKIIGEIRKLPMSEERSKASFAFKGDRFKKKVDHHLASSSPSNLSYSVIASSGLLSGMNDKESVEAALW